MMNRDGAPERIWATPSDGYCTATDIKSATRDALGFREYVLATHCDELVAAAYLDAARVPTSFLVGGPLNGIPFRSPMAHEVAEAIKDRTPDDASATLTAFGERMKAEGAFEAQAKIARLTEALTYYNDQFCEGFCSDVPAGFTNKDMENDCSGCRARAALQENANE